jgi:hypothetical protein
MEQQRMEQMRIQQLQERERLEKQGEVVKQIQNQEQKQVF